MPDHSLPTASAAEAPAAPAVALPNLARTIAFVSDETTATALRVGLISLGEELEVRKGDLRHAIRHFERDASAQVCVVDIEGIADPQTALEGLAHICPPNVRVVVIGDDPGIGFYRMLVGGMGVSEYLYKPLTRDTVQQLLLPIVSGGTSGQRGQRGGSVIAVCGARGGAGATTLAVNVALELMDISKGHVGLLDLHLQSGAAAAMLSARPGPGLRIALEDPERADSLFLDRTAIAVEPRLRLIAAEEAFGSAGAVSEAGVNRVVELLRARFNYVVVDLPAPTPPSMQRLFAMARHVVLAMGPDIVSVREAKAIRDFVRRLTGADHVLTVLNRADTKGGLPSELIGKGLGRAPDARVPDLGHRMLEAVNLGTPAIRHVRALRGAIAPLVVELSGVQRAAAATWVPRWLRR